MVTPSRVRNPPADRMARDAHVFDATDLNIAGRCVTVRPLRANDVAGYREFVEQIDRRDLRLRFGGDIEALEPSALARLVEVDDGVTFIATVATDDSGFEIAGDARARIDPHPYKTSAEFGIVVRSDLQRLGLGKALLERLIQGCRARGVDLLYGLVAPSNEGMLTLARRLGFDVEHLPGGTTVVVSLDLRPPQSPSRGRSARRRTQTPRDGRKRGVATARRSIPG